MATNSSPAPSQEAVTLIQNLERNVYRNATLIAKTHPELLRKIGNYEKEIAVSRAKLSAYVAGIEARERALLDAFAKRIYDQSAASDSTPWTWASDLEKNHYRMLADGCVRYDENLAAAAPRETAAPSPSSSLTRPVPMTHTDTQDTAPRTYQSAWIHDRLLTAEEWLAEEAHVMDGLAEPGSPPSADTLARLESLGIKTSSHSAPAGQGDDGPYDAGTMRAIAAEIATLRRERTEWADTATRQAAELIALRARLNSPAP